jgi:predicted outer membrane repeat protein
MAKLRPSSIDGSADSVEEMERVVERIRASFIALAITEHWSQHAKDAMYQRVNMLAGMLDAFGEHVDLLEGMSPTKVAPAPTTTTRPRPTSAASRQGPALIIAVVLIGLVLLGALMALTGGGEETPAVVSPMATPLPVTLTVGGDCALVDALLAASTGAASGGCTAAGAVTLIQLTGDVTLAGPYEAGGRWGLPPVTGTVMLDGGGFAIAPAEDAPRFSIFRVNAGGSLTLHRVTISGGGMGVYNLGTLSVFDSTFSHNGSGAIYNSGLLTVDGSTFDHNQAEQHGGAIYNTNGGATVSNSTFFANVAGGTGGAIYSYPDSRPDLPFTITHCTFTANYAPGGFGAIAVNTYHGGGIALYNSLLVGNVDSDHETNCGSVTTGSGNIDGDGSCPDSQQMDLSALDTALADNGGPTLTHALLAGSVAIDAGDPQHCIPSDQRGANRMGRCDAGAFEFGAGVAE